MAVWASVEYIELAVTAANEGTWTNLTNADDHSQCTPFYTAKTASIGDEWQERLFEIQFRDNAGTPQIRAVGTEAGDAGQRDIGVFVVEWDASINVQQVSVSALTETNTTTNVTITDVSAQADAFFWYSYSFTNAPSSDDDFNDAMVSCQWNGASTTSVTLTRGNSGGDCLGTLYVVDCDSSEWTVQHLSVATISDGSYTATASPSAVVMADTFILHSWDTDHGSDDHRGGDVVATLDSTTSVGFERSVGSSQTVTGDSRSYVQVVECNDSEWDVQRDEDTMNATSVTSSITSIDQDRAVIISGGQPGMSHNTGRGTDGDGNNHDNQMVLADFSADDTVRLQKQSTATSNDIFAWQVVQFAEASSEHSLTANDIESDSEVDTPALGQEHALTATDVQATSEVDSPALGQVHALTADDVESASEVDAPAIGVVHALTGNSLESASEVESPAVGQVHALTATDIESASEVDSPALGTDGTDALDANDVEAASEVDTPALGQIHALTAVDVESATEVGMPGLNRREVEIAKGRLWGANVMTARGGGNVL